MTFAEFMRLCLYHPIDGYYANNVPGRHGDYLTAPSLSPVFGACLARVMNDMWESIGQPPNFVVAEVGPGDGSLAAAALGTADLPVLDWVLVERQAFARSVQRRRLKEFEARWSTGVPSDASCVIANEVLDNFPVHLVLRENGALREAYVVEGSALELGELSDPRIATWVETHVPQEREGWIEVGLEATSWVTSVAAPYLLIIDYGAPSEALYRNRPNGTLAFWRDGQPVDEPFSAWGACDITAHVNFSALTTAANVRGASTHLLSQRDFLLAYGLRDELDALARRSANMAGRVLAMLSARNDAALLAHPNAMGRFKVLLVRTGAPTPRRWPSAAPRDPT